ncbi:MAG: hypothetical protein WC756_06635 [Taibaiella sp.]|jgi:hypothetical protein
MDDSFTITINYENKDYNFESLIVPQGFIHKIVVEVEGIPITFEPDEERNYRALVPEGAQIKNTTTFVGLLRAISSYLESILKS